jgi:hypothetical protein
MALQSFVGPWPHFSFLFLYTFGRIPWTGVQPIARPLPTHTYIRASSGIQTHDPSVRGCENISCLRQHGNCDRFLDSWNIEFRLGSWMLLRWQDHLANSPATRLEILRYPGRTSCNRAVAQMKIRRIQWKLMSEIVPGKLACCYAVVCIYFSRFHDSKFLSIPDFLTEVFLSPEQAYVHETHTYLKISTQI